MHWTYENIELSHDSLMQGDILWPTDDLRDLFRQIHPHFCDPKYIAFVVITQSCDLVRREGKTCRADYVNLAVVRGLESCLCQFLDNVCEKVTSGVYRRQSKAQAQQLLERILNQNEQALGLFYLHPDVDTIGIADCAVALLRVSVAFRAKEHYDVLQQARRGRLTPEFRSKLGWLVGNLYSRVGTRDWISSPGGEDEMKQLIRRLTDSATYCWVSGPHIRALKNAGISIADISPQDLPSILEAHRPVLFKDEIAKAAKVEVARVLARIPDEVVDKIENVLPGESLRAISPKIRSMLKAVLDRIPDKLHNRLINNPVVTKATSRDDLD
ncbi:MAG: hypothetical protein KBE65_19810 [Phycisphaerae bacterium]|nr:hypothetical protein [Phycisphaerae bacterium]